MTQATIDTSRLSLWNQSRILITALKTRKFYVKRRWFSNLPVIIRIKSNANPLSRKHHKTNSVFLAIKQLTLF